MRFHTHSLALILQIVAFAFLLIATLTTPVTTGTLKLAHDGDYSFGVFGYCKENSSCSNAGVGYSLSSLLTGSTVLNSSSIDTLTKVLIVAPIAAGLTLISLILNISAHISSKLSQSQVFWVVMIVLSFLTFAGSALLCIITFLIFYPRVAWPSWCLIPASVFNMAAVVLFGFAMRLMPSFDDIESEEQEEKRSEKCFAVSGGPLSDQFSNYDNSSLSFNGPAPAPVRTQLNLYSSDLDSSVKNLTANESTVSTESFNDQQTEKSDMINEESNKTSTASSDLKLPSINNPYLDSTNELMMNTRLSTTDTLPDQHTRSVSGNSSDSNFTSISQRGVNPKYYAGAPNKPNINMMNPQYGPHMQQNPRYNPNGPMMAPHGNMGPQFYGRGAPPPQSFRGYNQQAMPPQGYNNRGPYMRNPNPNMMMNGQRPPPGARPPPHNPYGYYGPPNPNQFANSTSQPPMRGYPIQPRYKNKSSQNFPAASQTGKGSYGF